MPDFLRTVRKIKNSVEHNTSLSLSDLLNLALFLLTVISLVLAGISVWIARDTLNDAKQSGEDARKSGAKQEQSLDESRAALVASKESLAKVQRDIASQQGLLEQNIKIARAQQNLLQANIRSSLAQQHLLEEGAQLASRQLNLAQAQNERQLADLARKPDLEWVLACHFQDASWISVEHAELIDPVNPPRRSIPREPDGITECELRAYNRGEKTLEKTSIRLDVFSGGNVLPELSDQAIFLVPFVSLSQPDDWEHARNTTLMLTENHDFPPKPFSVLETFAYKMRIPSTVDRFLMHFEIQSQNYGFERGQVNISVQK